MMRIKNGAMNLTKKQALFALPYQLQNLYNVEPVNK
jgi:hypothetical protein